MDGVLCWWPKVLGLRATVGVGSSSADKAVLSPYAPCNGSTIEHLARSIDRVAEGCLIRGSPVGGPSFDKTDLPGRKECCAVWDIEARVGARIH